MDGRRHLFLHLALVLLLAFGGSAAAHATLVFGTVATEPSPPVPDAPFALTLEMRDPSDAPVEDAIVFVEASLESGTATVAETRLEEVAPGTYRADLVVGRAGAWTLRFRDRTFRQEEARASVTLNVGEDALSDSVSFIFPPTATGPQSLSTWLVWLVGLPLLAGAVVTVMVLRRPAVDEAEAEDEGEGEGADGPTDDADDAGNVGAPERGRRG